MKYPVIEFHILQSFPVACLNRDDVGSPKICMIGGVERLRVSSQCWKRAVRQELHEMGFALGVRTKKVKELLLKTLLEKGYEGKEVELAAETIASALSSDTLLFMTDKEYEILARYAIGKAFDVKDIKLAEIAKMIKNAKVGSLNGLDIALFGRMVAKAHVMSVEAAASFAHAISTHEASVELDFFTAMDDLNEVEEEGMRSAHMGTNEFGSATYYRYISLRLDKVAETLGIEGDAKALRAVLEAFVKALYVAVPQARQATMSAACPWAYAKVLVRHGQRMQCALDKPVRAERGGGYLAPSIALLKNELERQERLSGSLYGKVAAFEFGDQSDLTVDQLIEGLAKAVGV